MLKPPTVAQMADHVRAIAHANRVEVLPHSRGGRASRRMKVIWIRPVKSAVTFATALHELGHVLGPWQSQPRLYSEAGAWLWARENTPWWSYRMTLDMRKALRSYHTWAVRKHRRGVSNAPKIPPQGHAFWELAGLGTPEYYRHECNPG